MKHKLIKLYQAAWVANQPHAGNLQEIIGQLEVETLGSDHLARALEYTNTKNIVQLERQVADLPKLADILGHNWRQYETLLTSHGKFLVEFNHSQIETINGIPVEYFEEDFVSELQHDWEIHQPKDNEW